MYNGYPGIVLHGYDSLPYTCVKAIFTKLLIRGLEHSCIWLRFVNIFDENCLHLLTKLGPPALGIFMMNL